jgi:hypothetical protein
MAAESSGTSTNQRNSFVKYFKKYSEPSEHDVANSNAYKQTSRRQVLNSQLGARSGSVEGRRSLPSGSGRAEELSSGNESMVSSKSVRRSFPHLKGGEKGGSIDLSEEHKKNSKSISWGTKLIQEYNPNKAAQT